MLNQQLNPVESDALQATRNSLSILLSAHHSMTITLQQMLQPCSEQQRVAHDILLEELKTIEVVMYQLYSSVTIEKK